MAKAIQLFRLRMLAILLSGGLLFLGYRLVDLQVLRHDELGAQAKRNTQRIISDEPLRGQIRDIRGVPLATSVGAKIVCADPKLIGDRSAEVARVLAPLLKIDESSLAQRLQPKIIRVLTNGVAVTNQHIVLKNKVKVEEWNEIQQALAKSSFGMNESVLTKVQKAELRILRQKAVFTEEDQLRVYPNQSLAAHVLGYIGANESGEMVGRNGIELSMDSKLSGVRGWRRTEMDRGRHELVAYRDQDVEARDGLNVVLTLDAGLQHIVETELVEAMAKCKPISVSATVIRPRTGEILAMATLPNFDPNRPGNFPPDTLRNRVISDLAEPGSTFKIVVVSGALNEGVVNLSDQFDCEHGRFSYAGRILHDHDSKRGILSVEGIITHSSNIGAAKIGIKMGEEKLYDYICKFGFGTRTGLPLAGEIRGIVYSPKDKENWTKVSIAQIPMGHGVAVTPLQMVMAMSAIANDGRLMRPILIDRLEDENGHIVAKYEPQVLREVVSSTAARQMVSALKTVVGADGTAPKAKLDHYTVAGKTGTAQKVENGHYSTTKFFSSFIGFFPADNPELCISIVMDEPKQGHYGGETAAPFFKNIAERAANYLNIAPDIFPELEVKETLAAATPNVRITKLSSGLTSK
jgi:cell division protein FtsI/penicillin-binding protein 2